MGIFNFSLILPLPMYHCIHFTAIAFYQYCQSNNSTHTLYVIYVAIRSALCNRGKEEFCCHRV